MSKVVNHGAFNATTLTPIGAYYLGLLMADGCVRQDRASTRIQLGSNDLELIEGFRAFVGSEHHISKRAPYNSQTRGEGRIWHHRTHYRLSFASKQMADDLAYYGIRPRKSCQESAHPLLALSPDFWRGVIDGDGNISPGGVVLWGGIGSPLLKQFLQWAGGGSIREYTRIIGKGMCADIRRALPAISTLSRLYPRKGDYPCLKRKRDAAWQAIEHLKKGRKYTKFLLNREAEHEEFLVAPAAPQQLESDAICSCGERTKAGPIICEACGKWLFRSLEAM